jgi:hypothetical protein
MDYPRDFPEHLKRPVDAAIHAAEIAFIEREADNRPGRPLSSCGAAEICRKYSDPRSASCDRRDGRGKRRLYFSWHQV